MKRDESTFEFDLGLTEADTTPLITEMVFVSDLLGPKGHLTNAHSAHGVLRVLHFKCVANSDYLASSRFLLCILPQSQVRILGDMSRIFSSLSDFIVGWSPFQNRYREKKLGNEDGIMSCHGLESSSIFDKVYNQTVVFDSLEGVEVYATALSDGKKGDFIEGYFIYVKK